MRVLKDSNEFFDLLDKIGDNKFVSVGYVTGANLDVPKIKKVNPATNRIKGYDDYSSFQDEGDDEIGALVKITSYNFRYRNRKSVARQYDRYKKDVDAIRGEFGLEPTGTKQGYKERNEYGNNGVNTYSGNRDELQGHSYYEQNLFGARVNGVVYAVNTEGHIIKELSPEQVQPYLKKKSEVSGVSALRKMGAEEEQVQSYIEKIGSLKMNYRQFEANSILWIAATVDGEKIVYINDNLARTVNDIDINPQDFIEIAKKRYAKELNNLTESYKRISKRIIRLTESDLHRMIVDCVKNIMESRKRNLNEVIGWDLEKDDVNWVNDENDGNEAYLVGLWSGSGYLLVHYGVYSFRGEEEALEKVVAWIEENQPDMLADEDYDNAVKDLVEYDGMTEEEAREELDGTFLYIDATWYGASEPHYIYLENLKIKPMKNANFR